MAQSPASGPGTATPNVLGMWLSEDGNGVFRIGRCGDTLCGALVGMSYHGDTVPLDAYKRPQCNMMLLHDFRPGDEAGHWSGSIYDPDNGHTYDATIWSPDPEQLKLRGYLVLPLFGETQSWTRYHGRVPDPRTCKFRP